jgi:hypothetical protein
MRLTHLKTLLLLVVALVVVLIVAGCGSSSLNTQKAQTVLLAGVQKQTGVKLASVKCPETVAPKKGGTFVCVAYGPDGTHAPIQVQQTNATGGINYQVSLLDQSIVEPKISAYVSKKFSVALSSVKCPDVAAYTAGNSFTCTLTASDGSTAKAVVTVGNDGTLSFNISH